ncbi:MAG: hypothetical protein R3D85_11940 [Paracoccaceae bacterium]
MSIAQGLDYLRDGHPACSLAAFGDLGTRLVLRSSAATEHPQEFYDKLCAQAAGTFGLSDGLQRPDGVAAGNEVVVLTPQDARVFVRSPENGSDFVGCICDAQQDLNDIAASAAAMLSEATATP